MAVEDVFKPPIVNPIDPKVTKEKDKASEWEKKTRDAKAEREWLEEQRRMDRITQPEQPPESPFQFKGSVNLGNIDFQEQQKQAKEEAERVRKESADEIKRLTEELNKTKNELQANIISAAMKEQSSQFVAALKDMNEKIEAVKAGADPSVMMNQFDIVTKIAEKMGFSKGTGQTGDPAIQLEITKLTMENALAQRKFEFEMQQRREDWELEKMKMQDERDLKREEMANERASEKRKNEQWGGMIDRLGAAAGQGYYDRSRQKVAASAPQGKRASRHIEAGVGEAGETECPNCQEPIAIGPTARTAVCASCNTRIPIKRTEKIEPEEE